MSIYNGLSTAFKHYLGLDVIAVKLKHRNRPQSNGTVFSLYSLSNRLLPFQFSVSINEALTPDSYEITDWRIVKSSVMEPFNVSLDPSDYIDVLSELATAGRSINEFIFKTSMLGKGFYFSGFYNNTTTLPFTIPEGDWYSVFKLKDGKAVVSEDFTVMCDDSFLTNNENILTLEWSNTKDIFDIVYSQNQFAKKFVNRVYLEGDLIENAPAIIEEGIQDDLGEFIPQVTTFIDKYQHSNYLPEYLYRALLLARGHDTLTITLGGYPNTGVAVINASLKECTVEWGESGIDGLVVLSFECKSNQKRFAKCDPNYTVGSPFPVKANTDYVEVYPHLGNVAINVMANDTGVGITTIPSVNQAAGTIQINMKPNGSFDIVSTGGITNQVHAIQYAIQDAFGGGDVGALQIKIVDWRPTPDLAEIPLLFVNWGGRNFNMGANQGYSVLQNDSYPINVNNVTCRSNTYFSTTGSGNYVIITSAGLVDYHIVNVSMWDRFLIQYKNNIVGNWKQEFLDIRLV